MKLQKQVIARLKKCYSIAPLDRGDEVCFLVASEKNNRCILFSSEGEELETVWKEPGGVMSMEQIPGCKDCFLAVQRFYSPDNAADAGIVCARKTKGEWRVQLVTPLPFVHRFGIVTAKDGVRYLVAATLKSASLCQDDWTAPGQIWAAPLPMDDLSECNEKNPLRLEPIWSGLCKNHGFCKIEQGKAALFGAQNGIYRVAPPENMDDTWKIEQILDTPVSDMALIDLDRDGEPELITFSPFHGETLAAYKKQGGTYHKAWQCERPLSFLHAIWGGTFNGAPVVLIGHRGGERDLLALSWQNGKYQCEVLDRNVGPANVMILTSGERNYIVSANRETDEVALYQ